MKKLLTTTVLTVLLTGSFQLLANAADAQSNGMMQGDMMKNCQMHMKDGKMMESMPKDMMSQCQEMMKDGGMMQGGMKDMKPVDAAKAETPKTDDADHKAHHPVQ